MCEANTVRVDFIRWLEFRIDVAYIMSHCYYANMSQAFHLLSLSEE